MSGHRPWRSQQYSSWNEAACPLRENHGPHEWAADVKLAKEQGYDLQNYQILMVCPGRAVFRSLTDVEEYLGE